ncbi:TonB-dependent receptor [Massilia sp. G4R7]|uniref:TonB-dependent receptor n=1 Tax=Massilia phyllostachyos TaxID=2898585 RepID=A0ABS8Q6R8_9BURK|nr:TonB-dependent receptor plug domain-containing protein [Massilia phyllostachyos]MCD2517437.1 TonB-dependent receptor [Massilia phyllostachyos]
MNETFLSRTLRRLFAGGSAAGALLCAPPLLAQTAPPAQEPPPTPTVAPMQRVEVTGSSIRRRLAAETSLPITTIRASDFAKQGLAAAQEVLNAIPMNQSSEGSSAAVGSGTGGRATADLRGLGGDKTLVLLNGRRLANHPYFADSIDLNIIPVAALERVEVLRDGASAIYGTDAIGGVINFITKRSVEGAAITFEGYEPYRRGGGNEQRLNLSGGWGDLERDGISAWGVIDWHQQSPLRATDRAFSRTGIRPDRGMFEVSGTTFLSNFFSDLGISGNPCYPACQPPASVALSDAPLCAYDYTRDVDNIPKTRQFSAMGRLSQKFGDHTGSEFFNKVGHYSTSSISATYTGNDKAELTAGIKNLFDEKPPFTNQVTNFQLGYDPRYTDPLGATVYMRLTYPLPMMRPSRLNSDRVDRATKGGSTLAREDLQPSRRPRVQLPAAQ